MKHLISFALLFASTLTFAQYEYAANDEYPFGKINPTAPEQLKDYAPLIGISDCESVSRNPDGTWQDPVAMEWRFKYIMNGFAVQDETLKADGKHSGSIRLYNGDSARWYVNYYSTGTLSGPLSYWEGGKRGEDMVLYRAQIAPNGMDGSYRLTFSDISEKRFKWVGEWVDTAEQIVYPTWRIDCTKSNRK